MSGRARKLLGTLEENFPGYGTDCRRQVGRTGTDPFRDQQHPKRSERRYGIGVERDEPGKRGCWGLPRDQNDGGGLFAVLAGYKFFSTLELIQHQGGLAIFYWEYPVFTVEAIHQFGANVISCQLATGERRWYIVGYDLAPRGGKTIRDVDPAMAEKPSGAELIVAGDLNVELGKTGIKGREEEITGAVASTGLEDMAGHHLFPRRRVWCRDWRTWSMRRHGRVVRSRTDDILGSDSQIFQNVAVRDPSHNSDHFMVVGSLCGASPREHYNYLGIRTSLLLRPPESQTRTQVNELFTELRRSIPKQDIRLAHHNSWISE